MPGSEKFQFMEGTHLLLVLPASSGLRVFAYGVTCSRERSGADETRVSGRKGKKGQRQFSISHMSRDIAVQPPGTGVSLLPSFFILQANHRKGRSERETMSASVAPSWLFQGAATRGCRDR